jgi:hypothetical protein
MARSAEQERMNRQDARSVQDAKNRASVWWAWYSLGVLVGHRSHAARDGL